MLTLAHKGMARSMFTIGAKCLRAVITILESPPKRPILSKNPATGNSTGHPCLVGAWQISCTRTSVGFHDCLPFAEMNIFSFYSFSCLFIYVFSLVGFLKGIYHYWTYLFIVFFPGLEKPNGRQEPQDHTLQIWDLDAGGPMLFPSKIRQTIAPTNFQRVRKIPKSSGFWQLA